MIEFKSYLSSFSSDCTKRFLRNKYSPSGTYFVCLHPKVMIRIIERIYVCLNLNKLPFFVQTNVIKAFVEILSKNKIKWIRSLRLKKNRDAEQLFIVEGDKMVRELLVQWSKYVVAVCTTDKDFICDSELFLTEDRIMKELSAHRTPSKLLAIVRMPKFEEESTTRILAIDGVQDPGNMGTIIRTADWFGIEKVVCSKETVDIFNPKVIQSSMGSLFRIPVEYMDLSHYLKQSELPIYGALLEGKNLYQASLEEKAIIVVGNEGSGITASVQDTIDHPVHIPGKGGAESLNVAVATGVILAEFSKGKG